MKAKKNKKNDVESSIIAGLQEIVDYKKGKISLRTTEVELPKKPKPISKKEIKEIREEVLEVSQSIFALYMGVSDETIKAWEQGKSKPKGPSLRLLHVAKKGKNTFLELISA